MIRKYHDPITFSVWSHRRGRKGFTLIELLIVIAIILILIAIALPNFLEAQMRARVTKTKAEIRSISIALEQYFLDFKIYPPENEADTAVRARGSQGLFWLTSPIKYLSKVPEDPFCDQNLGTRDAYYETGGIKTYSMRSKCVGCLETWAIFTRGPDMQENQVYSDHPHFGMYDDSVDSYSPTNGTKSSGDIFQFGGDPFWIGVAMAVALRANYRPSLDTPLIVDREPYLHRLPPKLR
jgi:type II secretion system protein G